MNRAYRDDAEIMPWLYNACMTVFRFKKYSSSRWISIGSSLRTLVAACALGIRYLYQFTIDDPKVGTYYLGGFKRLTAPMRLFSVVAAISSRPTETLSLAVFEDDRAVRNIEAYEGHLQEEIDWLQNLNEPVWHLLELACDSGSSCRAIRSDCLDCAHSSCSYVFKNFLQQVRSLPWCLAIGDVASNLDSFAASTEPVEDPVAKKIKALLGMKFNRPELEEAVSMLKECRWTTAFAEQLHAHAAVLHKLHREYGPETLCSRTMVAYLKLLTGTDPLVKEVQKARKKLSLLGRKQPERASGRSHFVGAFAHEAKEVTASGRTLTHEETQATWAAGSQRWDALTSPQKRAFHVSAGASSHSKRVCLEADKAKVMSDLALAQMRSTHELFEVGVQSRASSCRLTVTQRDRLQYLFETLGDIPALRRVATQDLDLPALQLVEDMSSVQIPSSAALVNGPEEWCKRICKHRDMFSQTILCVSSPSQKCFYYFMYATQSPQEVVLAPLKVRRDLSLQASGSFCTAIDVPALEHCAFFELSLGHYISGRALVLDANQYMYVIPHVGFGMGSAEVTADSGDAVWYMDFLKGQPEPSAPQHGSDGSRSRGQEQMLKSHPWMSKALLKKQGLPPESEEESEEDGGDEADKEMAADVVAQVMARLSFKRQEFQGLHDGKPHHFEVYLRREYAHRGSGEQAADAARGEALSTAQEFCRLHSLQMSSTYSFSKCGGEQAAHRLAQEWCRRMEYFFSAFAEQEHARVNWASVVAAFPVDPEFEQFVTDSPHDAVHHRAAQLSSIIPL